LGYVPIIFDFERPPDQDFTETIKVLAGMSLFIIADITNPKSTPMERQCCNLQAQTDYCLPCTHVQAAKSKRWSMNSICRGRSFPATHRICPFRIMWTAS
jgi:hypothetical protein